MRIKKNRWTVALALLSMTSLVSPRADAIEPCATAGIIMMVVGGIVSVVGAGFMIASAVHDENCDKDADPRTCREKEADYFEGGAWTLGTGALVTLAGGITYAARPRGQGAARGVSHPHSSVTFMDPTPSVHLSLGLGGGSREHASASSHITISDGHGPVAHIGGSHGTGGHVGSGRSVTIGGIR